MVDLFLLCFFHNSSYSTFAVQGFLLGFGGRHCVDRERESNGGSVSGRDSMFPYLGYLFSAVLDCPNPPLPATRQPLESKSETILPPSSRTWGASTGRRFRSAKWRRILLIQGVAVLILERGLNFLDETVACGLGWDQATIPLLISFKS